MLEIDMRVLEIEEVDQESWISGPRHRQYLKDAIYKSQTGESSFFGVFSGDDLIAYCGIRYDTTPDAGYMTMLTVREEYQGKGIGTKFIEFLEQKILEYGRPFVELSVEENNPRAQNLYIRLGYKPIRKQKETWEEDGEDGGVKMYTTMTDVMRKGLVSNG